MSEPVLTVTRRTRVRTRLPAGNSWRVVVASTRTAWADFTATFTPLSWTLGWLGRILAQVVFYALIGELLGSEERKVYLYIGAAVMATAMESLLVVSTTTRERYSGTLPLIVAAPGPVWPVFLGRSVQWLPSGIATATVALFLLGPLFGVSFTLASGVLAFVALVLVAATTYGYGLALAALVLRHMQLRNWATNLSYTVMTLVCGASVPLSFWPPWVEAIGQIFPITHLLEAIRRLEATDIVTAPATVWTSVLVDIAIALGTGLLWYVVGALSLERLASTGRRDGSIEYAE